MSRIALMVVLFVRQDGLVALYGDVSGEPEFLKLLMSPWLQFNQQIKPVWSCKDSISESGCGAICELRRLFSNVFDPLRRSWRGCKNLTERKWEEKIVERTLGENAVCRKSGPGRGGRSNVGCLINFKNNFWMNGNFFWCVAAFNEGNRHLHWDWVGRNCTCQSTSPNVIRLS